MLNPPPLPALPSVTVAVPTRNRAGHLPQCLEHVLAMKYASDWDVLVLDNDSADETPEVIAQFAEAHPLRLRGVTVKTPGLSNVRNHALRTTSADVLVFIDDDCYPSPDLITTLVREFVDPVVGFVGGRLLLHDITDEPYTINESTTRVVIEPLNWNNGDDIPGTGMALRRDAGLSVGGWDPCFGPGAPLLSGDDIDMYWRLTMAGWRGIYAPDAVTYHHHGRKPGSDRLSAIERDYAIARGGWYAKLLLDGPLRVQTLKAWGWWRIPHQPLRKTILELRGACRYLRLRLAVK